MSSIERNSQLIDLPPRDDSLFGQPSKMRLAASDVTSSISNPVCCDPPAPAPPAGIRMQLLRWLAKTRRTPKIVFELCSVVAAEIELNISEAAFNCSKLIRLASPGPRACISSADIPIGG